MSCKVYVTRCCAFCSVKTVSNVVLGQHTKLQRSHSTCCSCSCLSGKATYGSMKSWSCNNRGAPARQAEPPGRQKGAQPPVQPDLWRYKQRTCKQSITDFRHNFLIRCLCVSQYGFKAMVHGDYGWKTKNLTSHSFWLSYSCQCRAITEITF